MLRKALTSTSQLTYARRRNLLSNNGQLHRPTATTATHEARTASSLPLYSSSNSYFVHPHIHKREQEDANHSNLNLQPISLLNHSSLVSSHRHQHHQGNTNYANNTITTTRQYHTTSPQQRTTAIILSLASIAATAKAGQYVIQGYNEYKAEREREEKERREEMLSKGLDPDADVTTEKVDDAKEGHQNSGKQETQEEGAKQEKKEEKRENFFAKFFNLSVGSKYYEGGFEETMTRKEAALILGVRESSTPKRIKEAHRKLLILNHPDTGGSTYLAGKINEAKEMLLLGKKM